MSARIDTVAARQRPAVSMLPAGHFARAGGADLSSAEQQLVQDFRQMDEATRATLARLLHRQAACDRQHRAAQNVAGLRLVGGEA